MRNIVFDKDGTPTFNNLSKKEWFKHIAAGSIVGVRRDKSFLSEAILFFKPGFSSHDEFYLGQGKHMVASAEATGFRLCKMDRYMNKKGLHVRIYTNHKLTVKELEILKSRCYNLLASEKGNGYDYAAIFKKAWFVTCKTIAGWFGKADTVKPPEDDPDKGVCNERVIEIFQPDPDDKPFIKIIKSNVTLAESGPGDIDAYMESAEAKKAGWYIAAEWHND